MGYDAGAAGVYGLPVDLLTDQGVLCVFKRYCDDYLEAADPTGETDHRDHDSLTNHLNHERDGKIWRSRFINGFENQGIIVPDAAELVWSGRLEDRAGRAFAPPDTWFLGFGIFTLPFRYPPMHPTFRDTADWHTWTWGG